MRLPARFLIALAQAFAAMGLYREGHPARERAFDAVLALAMELQQAEPDVEFTFLSGEVIWGIEPLWDLKGWEWAGKFAEAGIQRLAFVGKVSRGDLEIFLDDVMAVLGGTSLPSAEIRQMRTTSIQYGGVRVRSDEEPGQGGKGASGSQVEDEEVVTATLGFTLREEADTVEWIHGELKNRDELHLLEAEAIVRSLSVAMHGDQRFLIPLLQLKRFDQYTTTHALNVSILAMALAEAIGMGPQEVRNFGISGLLHDLGKTRIPDDILNKPGKLSDSERAVMNSHTVEGARLIMETDHHLDLAAVVAYEHHIRIDGGGYPSLAYPRACHQCSKLVHVCDVYDALRTHRPYREAWDHDRVVNYIRDGIGTDFDAEIGKAFVTMMERWGHRIAIIENEDEPLPIDVGLELPPGGAPAPHEGSGAPPPGSAPS